MSSSDSSGPIITSSSAQPAAVPPKSHWLRWVLLGCAGFTVLIVLFVGGITFFVFSTLRNSEVVRTALDRVARHPAVTRAIGSPIQVGWLVSGSINVSGPGGTAELSIPISGPAGKGTLYVVARKSAGQWTFQTLDVEPEGGTRIHVVRSAEGAQPQPQ